MKLAGTVFAVELAGILYAVELAGTVSPGVAVVMVVDPPALATAAEPRPQAAHNTLHHNCHAHS